MTTELECKFFETFEIEPFNCQPCEIGHCPINATEWAQCRYCKEIIKVYPQITDTHYLELMCIFSDYINTTKKDVQELKNYILEEFITNQAGFSDEELIKIQALFKEK